MIEVYISKCSLCRAETLHRAYSLSRKRGYKLQCLECRRISKRYVRNPKLYDEKEAEGSCKEVETPFK